jgi:hypothetical protein
MNINNDGDMTNVSHTFVEYELERSFSSKIKREDRN